MKKILACILGFVCAFALELEQIEPRMNSDLQKAMKIVSTNETTEQKSNELFKLFDEYFDYALMSRLALASHYKNLSKGEQDKFGKVFEQRLKRSFSEKLSLYTNQKIYVKNVEQPSPTRYFVNSEISDDSGKIYKLIFKFYRADNGNFFIYDVDIIGVSIIQTYRAQFEDLSSKVSFDEILKRLNLSNSLDANQTK